jgi:hypothetical protein
MSSCQQRHELDPKHLKKCVPKKKWIKNRIGQVMNLSFLTRITNTTIYFRGIIKHIFPMNLLNNKWRWMPYKMMYCGWRRLDGDENMLWDLVEVGTRGYRPSWQGPQNIIALYPNPWIKQKMGETEQRDCYLEQIYEWIIYLLKH